MANVTINNLGEFNNSVLELKSKVSSSLKSNVDNINSYLSSIGNYSNNGFDVNVGDISNSLKSNFDNVLSDITNATENIFNYASCINELNLNDYDSDAKAVDLNAQYNSIYLNNSTSEESEDDDEDDSQKEQKNSKHSSSNNNDSTSEDSSSSSDNSNTSNETTTTTNLNSSVILMDSNTDYSNNFSDEILNIINNVTFNNEGFATFQNRYVVRMNESYGKVGDLIDIKQSDGTVLNCIIGLTHQETNSSEINFFVNQNTFKQPLEQIHPNWLKGITSIDNMGNYLNNVK